MPVTRMTCKDSTTSLSPERSFGSEEKGVQNSWHNPVCTQCLLRVRGFIVVEMEQETQMSLFGHTTPSFTMSGKL